MGNIESAKEKGRSYTNFGSDHEGSSSSSSNSNQSHHTSITTTTTTQETDQTRHNILHYMFELLFSSPIEETLRRGGTVLDVGCGSGVWLLDMASIYTVTQFYGIDCVPSFPTDIAPVNVTFYQDNVLDGIAMRANSFDFVRISLMFISLSPEEYADAIREAIRILKPGGYLEICEPHCQLSKAGPLAERLMTAWSSLVESKSVDLRLTEKLPTILASTGQLENIEVDTRMVPLAPTGDRVVSTYVQNLQDYCRETIPDLLSGILGVSMTEYLGFWNDAKKEFRANATEFPFRRFWAQKV